MKTNPRLAYLSVTAALLTTSCATRQHLPPSTMEVTATAYSSGASCNGPWAGKNAVGTPLRAGALTSAATDWSRLPLGTIFRVRSTGKSYIVDDYGSAMVGRDKVDLYKTNYADVRQWGVRQVTLDILRWGCLNQSLKVLRPRVRHSHVRRMIEDLEARYRQEAPPRAS